jgi:hypothetical protein
MAWLDIGTNVSDTISFLLVTTDLYGRERLGALSTRLLRTGHAWRLNPLDFWRQQSFARDYLIYVTLAGLAVGLIVAVRLIVDEHGADWWLIVLMPVGLCFMFFCSGLMLSCSLWAAWFLSRIAGYGLRWLIERYKVDGAMLLVGTFLFVVTRGVDIWFARP